MNTIEYSRGSLIYRSQLPTNQTTEKKVEKNKEKKKTKIKKVQSHTNESKRASDYTSHTTTKY